MDSPGSPVPRSPALKDRPQRRRDRPAASRVGSKLSSNPFLAADAANRTKLAVPKENQSPSRKNVASSGPSVATTIPESNRESLVEATGQDHQVSSSTAAQHPVLGEAVMPGEAGVPSATCATPSRLGGMSGFTPVASRVATSCALGDLMQFTPIAAPAPDAPIIQEEAGAPEESRPPPVLLAAEDELPAVLQGTPYDIIGSTKTPPPPAGPPPPTPPPPPPAGPPPPTPPPPPPPEAATPVPLSVSRPRRQTSSRAAVATPTSAPRSKAKRSAKRSAAAEESPRLDETAAAAPAAAPQPEKEEPQVAAASEPAVPSEQGKRRRLQNAKAWRMQLDQEAAEDGME